MSHEHNALDLNRELLHAKKPFVWNPTHLSAQMRAKTLDLCFIYQAQVELVRLEQPRAQLLARNARRDTSLSRKALLGMLHRWEVSLLTEAHRERYLSTPQKLDLMDFGLQSRGARQ